MAGPNEKEAARCWAPGYFLAEMVTRATHKEANPQWPAFPKALRRVLPLGSLELFS